MMDFPRFYTSNNHNNDNELASTWWFDCRRTFLSSGYVFCIIRVDACRMINFWLQWHVYIARESRRKESSELRSDLRQSWPDARTQASKTSPGFNQGEKKMMVKRKTSLDAFSDTLRREREKERGRRGF